MQIIWSTRIQESTGVRLHLKLDILDLVRSMTSEMTGANHDWGAGAKHGCGTGTSTEGHLLRRLYRGKDTTTWRTIAIMNLGDPFETFSVLEEVYKMRIELARAI